MYNEQKSSQQAIKEANTKLIFNILKQHQPISRADIKKITKLSATTVSVLADELIVKGLIEESGMSLQSEVGRKAILLRLKNDGAFFAGMEVCKDKVKCDVYDLSFTAIKSFIKNYSNSSELSEAVLELADSSVKYAGKKLFGISIGVPALVDSASMKIISSSVLNVKVEEDLFIVLKSKYSDIFVNVCNNSALIAYAETELHSPVNNLLSIDIGEGVGSGIVIDGDLYAGFKGISGEFGHMTIDYNGKLCRCGARGCIEGLVSIPVLLENVSKAKNLNILDLDDVVKLLEQNDPIVISIVENTAKLLSFGINNAINLIDPDIVVLSGEIKKLGIHFLNPLLDALNTKCLAGMPIKVVYSDFEGNGVTLGATYYAFKNCFN